MRVSASLTPLVERIHTAELDVDAWLAGIREIAERSFEGPIGAAVYTIRIRPGEGVTLRAHATPQNMTETFLDCLAANDGDTARVYRSGPILQSSRLLAPDNPITRIANRSGLLEVFTAIGFASATDACAISFPLSTTATLSRSARTALARIAAHLGAACRLRVEPGAEEAVLSSNGAVLHASGDAEPRAARERLRDAAQRVLYAKRESSRDPVGGLAFWTAMVDGRWTLVERTDTDGKRLIFARRNVPRTVRRAALSERERSVVERASLGSSLRHIAYELGLAENTVSETLKRGMKKLGIRSRAELIELYAAIVGTSAPA